MLIMPSISFLFSLLQGIHTGCPIEFKTTKDTEIEPSRWDKLGWFSNILKMLFSVFALSKLSYLFLFWNKVSKTNIIKFEQSTNINNGHPAYVYVDYIIVVMDDVSSG